MAMDILGAAVSIVNRLRDAGFEAYFAGGFVRDKLLSRAVADIDIATSARPEDVERLFRKTVPVGKSFGVIRVLIGEQQFEVATFRADGRYLDGRRPESVAFSTIESDVRRRDFTINGMMFDPLEDRIVDLVGGQEDLKRRLVRAIGRADDRFEEDKLRLMRAVRFACQLGFSLESETEAAVRRLAGEIAQVSAERIAGELRKILVSSRRAEGMELLHRTGLLRVILPEVAAMEGVPQPPEFHPEGDVWVHTKLALASLPDPSFEIALAVLLHDIGKPKTLTVTDRIRFNDHAKVGARMAEEIGVRLRLPRETIDLVVWLVDRHLAFIQWQEMRVSTLKRLLGDPRIEDLFRVIRADSIGSGGDGKWVDELRCRRDEYGVKELRPEPLLTGTDLIALGFSPGPLFSEILRAVTDAQLEGRLKSRDEASDFVKERWRIQS